MMLLPNRVPIIFRAALLAAALAVLPHPAAAQADRAFGDWLLRCDIVPGSGEQCALTQSVADAERENVWLQAYAFRPEPGGTLLLLSILTPLEVILTRRLGLRIDASPLRQFDFIKCSVSGCLVSIDLNAALLAALTEGTEALFIYYFEDAVGLGVPISLAGLGDGLAALP